MLQHCLLIAAQFVFETASRTLQGWEKREISTEKQSGSTSVFYLVLALALMDLPGNCNPETSEYRLSTEAIDGR